MLECRQHQHDRVLSHSDRVCATVHGDRQARSPRAIYVEAVVTSAHQLHQLQAVGGCLDQGHGLNRTDESTEKVRVEDRRGNIGRGDVAK
jgi:hypothetical protein